MGRVEKRSISKRKVYHSKPQEQGPMNALHREVIYDKNVIAIKKVNKVYNLNIMLKRYIYTIGGQMLKILSQQYS